MHRIKKILIYLSIFTGFIFCFLFGKYINTLAVTNIENTLGSYPIQIDIDDYKFKSDNLLDMCIFYNSSGVVSNGITTTFNEDNCFINSTGVVSGGLQWFNATNNRSIVLEPGTYTISANHGFGSNINAILRFNNIGDFYLGAFNNFTRTFTTTNPTSILYIYFETGYINYNVNISDLAFQIVKGDVSLPFEPYYNYGFGFNVDLVINDPGNSSYNSVNGTLNINTKINNISCYNSSYSISTSTTYYRLNNICFIPFNIDSKGYISLNEINLNTTFTSSNISVFQGESGYILTPYLKGYYKGELVENIIYLKNSYVSNSFYLNGFTARITDNNDEKLTSVSIRPYNDNEPGDETFGLTKDNQSFNFISELVTEVKFYNSININNNLNFQLGLTYGQFQQISEINTLNYVFSLSGINSIVINDISATSPLPNNPNTNNKYNTCSAWYDIPCQLGNAVTYVIYEAPIISPIISFFDNFIDLIGILVTYITWFEGLGLIFGVFIVIFFIRMIILLVKGGNDD